ncbi:MAG TPA: hypothetical protein PLN83_07660 [Syntrophorhabdus sp.]|nr:hypothetical protein [Syntrophorhabdus sp.]
MDLVEFIYSRSPVLAQNLAVSWYGWSTARRRYRGEFLNFVEQVRDRERWPREDLESYQDKQILKLCHSASASPFYHKRFEDAGFKPERDAHREGLKKLPFLTKDEYRSCANELLTRKPERGVITFKSSGTTGTPCRILRSRRTDQHIWAYWEARCWNWFGSNWRSRKAVFGVRKVHPVDRQRPPFWRRDWLTGVCYFSVYHLRRDNLRAYCEALQEFQPEQVLAYPSAIWPVVSFALNEGIKLPVVKGVVTTSETLLDQQKAALEAAFSCQVYDQYGAAEACVFGATCEHGRLHLSPDYAFVEILLPDGRPAKPGEAGEIVCTGFMNDLQPLIRYRLGDVVRLSDKQDCPCGRQMPILDRIEGRVEDTLWTLNGDPVIRFDTVFKGIDGVVEGQVAQLARGEFEIRVVIDGRFSESESSRLVWNMNTHLGPGHTVSVRVVESIPRTKGGKFKAVSNEVQLLPHG